MGAEGAGGIGGGEMMSQSKIMYFPQKKFNKAVNNFIP